VKTPLVNFDVTDFVRELGEVGTKLVKGTELLAGIDDIDVGTAPKELVHEEDKLKLYRYRQPGKVTCGVPVLIVYALVNRQYMLDIQPDRSIVRNLLAHGLDVYIIDWGYPTKADMCLGLDDYISGYLDSCVDVVRAASGKDRVNLMGICQGGTFCGMYAALYPEKVRNLVTLVAPFDFATDDGLLFAWSKHLDVDALVDTYRVIPGEFMNSGFLTLMPFRLNIRKYGDMLEVIGDRE
jgi:polyhydroxyalkanoate synthase